MTVTLSPAQEPPPGGGDSETPRRSLLGGGSLDGEPLLEGGVAARGGVEGSELGRARPSCAAQPGESETSDAIDAMGPAPKLGPAS